MEGSSFVVTFLFGRCTERVYADSRVLVARHGRDRSAAPLTLAVAAPVCFPPAFFGGKERAYYYYSRERERRRGAIAMRGVLGKGPTARRASLSYWLSPRDGMLRHGLYILYASCFLLSPTHRHPTPRSPTHTPLSCLLSTTTTAVTTSSRQSLLPYRFSLSFFYPTERPSAQHRQTTQTELRLTTQFPVVYGRDN